MRIILCFLLIFSLQASETFLIEDLSPHPNRRDVFFLLGPHSETVTLDCSSFLHGVTVEDQNRRDFLYLYENECHDLGAKLIDFWSYQVKSCLTVDFTGKDWLLEKTDDGCP